MHGLKSAVLAISQKLADWLDWPCPGVASESQRNSNLREMKADESKFQKSQRDEKQIPEILEKCENNFQKSQRD